MKTSLQHIKKPFNEEIKEYEMVFSEIMTSNIALIDVILKYVIKHKGKGLRPLIVLMAAKQVGKINQQTYRVASVIELLHTASLIHDDVVDEANLRRGFPSINAAWKNKIAVLMGDYLLSKCLIGATETGNMKIMNMLANVSKSLSKGELLQIEKSRKMNITEKDYFSIIHNKTAGLISAAAYLGAITTSEDEEDHSNLKEYGENLGIAFQIKDDLLDYYGHWKLLGKDSGNDFKNKKITLPLISAFNNAGDKETKKIKRLFRKKLSKKEEKFILDFVYKYNGIEYSENKCQEFSDKAKTCLNKYPDSEVKRSMISLTDYVVMRKK
ncbi:MAG: polyprenyl synthetase family protein [Calditrichaeota bacterium]|nr:MAG: polyprenyl synthetase family protein [Calditrichota bacterium]